MIYIIQDKDDRNFTNQDFLNMNDNVKEMWNVKVTFSAYRGRCYTFEYKKEVKTFNLSQTVTIQHSFQPLAK